MQLGWELHFKEIVVPAWQAYLAAEKALTEVVETGDERAIGAAEFRALREGGAAAFYLHHFADIVFAEGPEFLELPHGSNLGDLRAWLSSFCFALRTEEPSEDVNLLRDVADALKHAVLTRNTHNRHVAANDAVVVIETGYGSVPFGEGKYGGVNQVVVLTNAGVKRPLSSILQNVVDAWRRARAINPLPAIGAA